MTRQATVGSCVLALLACSGVGGERAVDDPATEAAIQQIVVAMENDTDPPDPVRTVQNEVAARELFRVHDDAAERAVCVADVLLAEVEPNPEDAYQRCKREAAEQPPVIAEVGGGPWRVLVIVRPFYATSEDWMWFSLEVERAASAKGIVVVEFSLAGETRLSVERNGDKLAEFGFPKAEFVHYVAVREGAEPQEIAHQPTEDVLKELGAYYGIEVPQVPVE